MPSQQPWSRLRRSFPRLAEVPGLGALFRLLDALVAVPLERRLIDRRVRRRMGQAHLRNRGATARLRLAGEVDGLTSVVVIADDQTVSASIALAQVLPTPNELIVVSRRPRSLDGVVELVVPAGDLLSAALVVARGQWVVVVENGIARPTVERATLRLSAQSAAPALIVPPAELARLPDGSRAAVFVDDARQLHRYRMDVARAEVCIAGNRGLLELCRLYHPLAVQVPTAAALVDVARTVATPTPHFSVAGPRQRVLFQVDDFRQGGLEQVISDLVEVLPRQKCDVAVLVLGECGPAVERLGIPVHRIAATNRTAAYLALLAAERPTVINAHFSLFGAEQAAALGIPFVQTLHNSYTWLDKEALAAQRAAARHTAAFVCVSTAVAYYAVEAMGLPAAKITVLPNGIANRSRQLTVDERRAKRAEFGFSDDDFVVANVGAISDVKAQLQLVRALGKTRSQRLKVLLIGRAADPDYERVVRQLQQPNVVFAGHRSDVNLCLAAADAFALPSFWEGDSLALGEALLAGLPVIASDAGRARELVSEGIIVPLPFDSIVDVRADTIERYLGDDERMVEALAQAMLATARAPTHSRYAPLDRQAAYTAYAELFRLLSARSHHGV